MAKINKHPNKHSYFERAIIFLRAYTKNIKAMKDAQHELRLSPWSAAVAERTAEVHIEAALRCLRKARQAKRKRARRQTK